MSAENIQNAIDESLEEIRELDEALMMEVVGVAEAIDRLRGALDQLNACLDEREFERASDLGYRNIASNFIFLQRTLCGLQQQALKKSRIISDIALRSGVGVYEQVAPFVEEILQSSMPITPEEKEKNRKAAKTLRKHIKELQDRDEGTCTESPDGRVDYDL